MKNGILPIAFGLFAAYFYAKDYSNSTIIAGFYDEFMKKREEYSSSKKHISIFYI